MNWTDQRQQEAHQVIGALDEMQWKAVQRIIAAFTHTPTKEEKAEAERNTRQREAAAARRQADLQQKRDSFKAWAQKKLRGLTMPTRYDFSLEMIQPLLDYVTNTPDKEGLYDTISFMYDWGFLQGTKYIENQSKKKAAFHAANMNDGAERFNASRSAEENIPEALYHKSSENCNNRRA